MKIQLNIWIFKGVNTMSMDEKHFEDLARMKSLEGMDKWYSWESPIGLAIFLLALTGIAVLIKWAFFSQGGL